MTANRNDFYQGKKTQTAGTVITVTIDARRNRYTRVTSLLYVVGANAHLVTWFVPLCRSTLSAGTAAGNATLVLTDDLNTLGVTVGAGDYVVVRKADSLTCFTSTVSSYTAGTKTLVMVDNAPTGGLASGAKVWFLGAAAAHTTSRNVDAPANSTIGLEEDPAVGVVTSPDRDDPIMFYSNNVTTAGTLEQLGGLYVNF